MIKNTNQVTLETGYNFTEGTPRTQVINNIKYKSVNMALHMCKNDFNMWEVYSRYEHSKDYDYFKHLTIFKVAQGIRDTQQYKTQFKKLIKTRIEENNGVEYIKLFEKYFDYEKSLSKITGKSSLIDIQNILIKNWF